MHNHFRGSRGISETQGRLLSQVAASPSYDRNVVESVVRSIFSTLHGDLTGNETSLLAEVEELGRTIASAKAEIAALRVDDITDSHIPSATDELDAIVAHTATATNCILEVCETLDAISAKMDGPDAELMIEATSRIYEACSFQDITGQRINKVVTTLKTIDEKIAHIVASFSAPERESGSSNAPMAAESGSLLNGPQLPMVAMGQSEIDKLLASFE